MSFEVVIVGAGIGGLTAALALRRGGHPVVVVEKAAELRALGAGLVLGPNAMAALRALDLEPRVLAAGRVLGGLSIVDHQGQVLSSGGGPLTVDGHVYPTVALHRAALQELLLDACQERGVDVRWGSEITRFDDTSAGNSRGAVEVTTTRENLTCDVLVGADGLHSFVRTTLHGGDDLRMAGYRCFRGVTAQPFAWPDSGTEAWGPGQRLGLIPLGGGHIYWFAVENARPGTWFEAAAARAHVLERFSHFGADARRVLEATEVILTHDLADRVPLESWGRGQVTLLGDAAHPMTPNLGQGACQAIEDAACLGALFAEGRWGHWQSEGLRAYESARVARANQFVQQSWRLGQLAQLENPALCWLRNTLMRLTPRRVTDKSMYQLLAPGTRAPQALSPVTT